MRISKYPHLCLKMQTFLCLSYVHKMSVSFYINPLTTPFCLPSGVRDNDNVIVLKRDDESMLKYYMTCVKVLDRFNRFYDYIVARVYVF